MSAHTRWALLLLSLLSLRCTQSAEGPSDTALPAGVVAQVAGRPIATALVEAGAEASDLGPREILARLVRGELWAAELAAERPELLRVAERASHARALLSVMRREALSRGGPITSEETGEVVQRRWVELARPRAVRTAHVVTLPATDERREAARALAERVAEAVRGITDPQKFADRAAQVAAEPEAPEGVQLRAEGLPPVAQDGRTVPVQLLDRSGPVALVSEYADAAQRLRAAGEQSPVVETSYGFHVLLALEILPEIAPSPADIDLVVRDEALSARARTDYEELVTALRSATPVEVARNAVEQTRAVWDLR